MSAVSTATALAGAQAAQTQASIAAHIVKQNQQATEGLIAVIKQAAEAGKEAAASPPPGTGAVVDVKA